jgi:CheY-like chemotaxis protein
MNSQVFPADPSPLPPKKSGRKLILSVDDEPVILLTREIILQREGYAVVSAPSGAEAVKAFLRHAIDLVLLDYVMPGMDGGIVAQEMRRRKPRVPIIMVSANQVPEQSLTCVDRLREHDKGLRTEAGYLRVKPLTAIRLLTAPKTGMDQTKMLRGCPSERVSGAAYWPTHFMQGRDGQYRQASPWRVCLRGNRGNAPRS